MSRQITPKERVIDFFLTAPLTEVDTTLTTVRRIVTHRTAAPSLVKAKAKPVVKRHRRTKAEMEASKKVDSGLAEIERSA